jgi:N-acetylglucosaminyl-diphospho-decaprenol L-rhamnosyltransferase
MNKKLTIIIVSFLSKDRIKKLLNKINSSNKIVIVENSLSTEFKKYVESNYKNAEVLIPQKNLGNGGGINFAIKKIKTKFALYLDIDVVITQKIIKKLYLVAKRKKQWAIIAPNLRGVQYKKEFFIKKNSYSNISEMSFVEGCSLLFNVSTIKKIGLFDEKFFLYYEENDLFFRCLKKNKKILMLNNIYVRHMNNNGSDKKYSKYIDDIRNWHLMWSKFYYYKKNFSFCRGILETYKSFISSFIKTIYYYLINERQFKKYYNRFSGLLNSYIGKRSWKRVKIRNENI